jgi:integrase
VSAAYRRRDRKVFETKVPTEDGRWAPRSLETRDRETAKKMQRMVDDLGPLGARAWDVLRRITDKPGSLDVATLFDKWNAAGADLPRLRELLDDVNLEPLVETWNKALIGPNGGVSADTAAHYLSAVRSLIPEAVAFKRSALTPARLQQWLEDMEDVEPATVRKRGQGMRSLCEWLVAHGHATTDPMREVSLPAAGKPRTNFLETADAVRLADAQPSPFREFSALLAGSGIEVSVALELRRRDVDAKHREIRAPGTKTHARDRVVRVAGWAWKLFAPLLERLHPDAKVFAGIKDRWIAADAHNAAIAVLLDKGHAIYAGYTMRDARHTYAVRAIRAGTPAELVARQLGHVNAVLVHSTYGRFSPKQEERQKWEKIAEAQDKAEARRLKRVK